jgi:hypothetical protein
LGNNHALGEEGAYVAPGSNHVHGGKELKLPRGVAMFFGEQMCLKFLLIITFAYEF